MQPFVNIGSLNLRRLPMRPGVYRRVSKMLCSLGLALCLAPAVATAKREVPSSVAITITVYKVDETGKKAGQLLPPEQAKAGDFLIYRASYRNLTKDLLPQIAVNVTVPVGMVYVDNSARPAAFRASADGSSYFPITTVPNPSPVRAWRAVQWKPRDLGPLSELVSELKVQVVGPSGE